MAKRQRRSSTRRNRQAKQETNWVLIGGIIIGAVIVIGLLALALRPAEAVTLANFCKNNPENCMAKGDPNAPVTIVEVSDYSCGHCANFNLDSADLFEQTYVDTGQVYWIVLPFALRIETTPAAESAYCAQEQGGFFEYHRQMFEIQELPAALSPAGFLESAARAGLDLEQFNACLEADNYGPAVQANLRAASQARVSSTPTFFVNGERVVGNNPNGIVSEIEAQLNS